MYFDKFRYLFFNMGKNEDIWEDFFVNICNLLFGM